MRIAWCHNVLPTFLTAHAHFDDRHVHRFFGGVMTMRTRDNGGTRHLLLLTLVAVAVTIVCGIRTKDATIARTGRQPLPALRAVPMGDSGTGGNGCRGRVITVRTGD